MSEKKISYAIKPDAQPFDEIRIRIVPRWKDSELSGSEWRQSCVIEFYRNGNIEDTSSCGGKLEYGAGLAYARLLEAQDNGKGYFASDKVHCDQEGCHKKAQYLMKLKERFCVGGGNCGQKKEQVGFITSDHRIFCEKHKRRGNQDLEDNDANYELIDIL